MCMPRFYRANLTFLSYKRLLFMLQNRDIILYTYTCTCNHIHVHDVLYNTVYMYMIHVCIVYELCGEHQRCAYVNDCICVRTQ